MPVIRLFKKIIKDEKTKNSYASTSYGSAQTGTTGGPTVINHGANTTSDGKTLYSKSYGGGQNDGESIYPSGTASGQQPQSERGAAVDDEEGKQALQVVTMRSVLNNLYEQQGFVEALLANLEAYCATVASKVGQSAELAREQDRSKLFVLGPKHSHQEEVNERLSFLQEFAVNSDFKISKAQLKVIYDLLTKSPVKSDFSEFLVWCNTACSAQTATTSVLDLEEVGEFFSELINNKTLNLGALPSVGFEFLKMYFTSQNLEQNKLLKIVPPQKIKVVNSWSSGYFGSKKKDEEQEPQDDDPTFKITVEPSQLTKLDMIWAIALESQQPDVIGKSIAFLVNCYMSVSDDLENQRVSFMQSLNARCFELIAASQS